MPEETEFTFSHFIEAELLQQRVDELAGRYTDEEVAGTAFYLGVLSITGFSRVIQLFGDPHYLMHVMANVYAGEWLSEIIKAGAIDPEAMHALVLKEHGWALKGNDHDGMEDIQAPSEVIPPMDRETFSRMWGHSA